MSEDFEEEEVEEAVKEEAVKEVTVEGEEEEVRERGRLQLEEADRRNSLARQKDEMM